MLFVSKMFASINGLWAINDWIIHWKEDISIEHSKAVKKAALCMATVNHWWMNVCEWPMETALGSHEGAGKSFVSAVKLHLTKKGPRCSSRPSDLWPVTTLVQSFCHNFFIFAILSTNVLLSSITKTHLAFICSLDMSKKLFIYTSTWVK